LRISKTPSSDKAAENLRDRLSDPKYCHRALPLKFQAESYFIIKDPTIFPDMK
jgi:hypothetical protein